MLREALASDSDTEDASHSDLNFEGLDDDDDEEEDLMYDANDYLGEAPIPEQIDIGMDIDESEGDEGAEIDLFQSREVRWAAEEAFRKTPFVEAFPSVKAGSPISANIQVRPRYDSYKMRLTNSDNPWAPFLSRLDWEIAHWAILHGPSATAFIELLKIDGVSQSINTDCGDIVLTFIQVRERLGLSYNSSRQLNNIIDNSLPDIPKFQCDPVVVGNEVFEMYSRNIIDCIKDLFGDPEFAPHLLLTPERQYEDITKTNKLMHEMNTCRWWWNTQVIFIFIYPSNVLTIYSGSRKPSKLIHQAPPSCL